MNRALYVALLIVMTSSAAAAEPFRFTVTADGRQNRSKFQHVLSEIDRLVGDEGVFHASPGDIDPPADTYADLVRRFGSDVVWYPGVGNHEEETASDMEWLRAFFPRVPNVVRRGPAGTDTTTYSFDYGNAHFVNLNLYFDGRTDDGGWGEVGDVLYEWLAADLRATDKPVKIVFGHEPAFPQYRHIGDSLDQNPASRDRFWKLLEDSGVQAYIVGHTHHYSRYQPAGSPVVQVDTGNAGVDSPMHFLDVTVAETFLRIDAWQGVAGGAFGLIDTVTVPVEGVEPAPAPLVALAPTADVIPENGGSLTLRLSREGSAGSELRVAYELTGTATAEDVSVSATGGTIVLAPGQATADIGVTAIDDGFAEEDETLVLSLLPGAGYELGDAAQALVVISDDENDSGLPRVAIQAASVTAQEGGQPATVVVTRTGDTSGALTVQLATAGLAVDGDDYELDPGTEVTLAPGESAAEVKLFAFEDGIAEGEETLVLEVVPGAGHDVGEPSWLELTITDAETDVTPPVEVDGEASGCSSLGGPGLGAVLFAPAFLAVLARIRRRRRP